MAKSTSLTVKILADNKSARRGFDDTERRAGGLGKKLGGFGTIAAGGLLAVAGAVATIGTKAFEAASKLEQSTGAVESVFGKQAAAVEKAAGAAAEAVGLSKNDYNELAAVIGSQLKNAGTAQDQLASKTDNLVGLGADLAATFGGTTADAVGALSSLMRGETDPIERYGVSIKDADIKARMAAQGTDKLTGAQGKAARTTALMSLLTEQTAAAQGQAARESDSAAGAQQRLSAKFENLMAVLGEKLLPVFVTVVEWIEQKIVPAVQGLIGEGGGLSDIFAKVGAYITDLVIPAFEGIWAFIQEYVVPILKSVLGPAIDGISGAFKTVTEAIKRNQDKFEPLMRFLRDKVAPFVGGALKEAFGFLGDVIGTVVDAVAWLAEKLEWLLDKGSGAIEWAQDLFGAGDARVDVVATDGRSGLSGAASAITAPLRGSIMGSSSGGSAPAAGGGSTTLVNITVEGALDPVAVGRQIDQLVRRYATTSGRAPVALGWAR